MKLITLICDICGKSGEFVSGESVSPWYEDRQEGVVENITFENIDIPGFKRDKIEIICCSHDCVIKYNSILKAAKLLSEITWIRAVKDRVGLNYDFENLGIVNFTGGKWVSPDVLCLEKLLDSIRDKQGLPKKIKERDKTLVGMAKLHVELKEKLAQTSHSMRLFIGIAVASLLINMILFIYFAPRAKPADRNQEVAATTSDAAPQITTSAASNSTPQKLDLIFPKDRFETRVKDMPLNTCMYIVPWAVSVDEQGRAWVGPNYTVHSKYGGTVRLPIIRTDKGYAVDIDFYCVGSTYKWTKKNIDYHSIGYYPIQRFKRNND